MMNRKGFKQAITNKIQSMGGMDAMRSQVAQNMPRSMFYRPPVIANKARGTMSSSTYAPIKGAF